MTNNIKTENIAISIPDYATMPEQIALANAAKIAGFKHCTLVSESVSLALSYGFFRRKDMFGEDHNIRTVAFIDVGHSKTTISFIRFSRRIFQILGHYSDRNLGIRNFDHEVMLHVGNKFAQKYKVDDPCKNIRCRLLLRDAIEKARKVLTADKEAPIHIDCLLDDEDLSEKIQRTEFEEIIAEKLKDLKVLFEKSLQAFEMKNPSELIHSIELVSDGTRIPSVQ